MKSWQCARERERVSEWVDILLISALRARCSAISGDGVLAWSCLVGFCDIMSSSCSSALSTCTHSDTHHAYTRITSLPFYSSHVFIAVTRHSTSNIFTRAVESVDFSLESCSLEILYRTLQTRCKDNRLLQQLHIYTREFTCNRNTLHNVAETDFGRPEGNRAGWSTLNVFWTARKFDKNITIRCNSHVG